MKELKSFALCMLCLRMFCPSKPESEARITRELHNSLFQWELNTDRDSQQKPEFRETERIVTVNPGDTAVLKCQVENLGSKTVTWRRYGSIHPLTIGSITFVSNSRVHAERKKLLLTTTTTRPSNSHVITPEATTSKPPLVASSTPQKVHQVPIKSERPRPTSTESPQIYGPFQPILIPARNHRDDYDDDDDDDDDYMQFAFPSRRQDVLERNSDGLDEQAMAFGQQSSNEGRFSRKKRRSDDSSVDEWNLFITDVRHSDQDIYQCQVNSKDDQYKFYDIFLKVKNIHVYGTQKVEQGSEIQLTCNVTSTTAFQQPTLPNTQQQHHHQQYHQQQLQQLQQQHQQSLFQKRNSTSALPNFLAWFKDGQLVVSDLRKGISVSREISEKSSASVLTVRRAQPSDAGIYVCREGTDWKSRWNKQADNLVDDETLQHSSVLDSSAHSRQHHDSLLNHAFQPDSASIYVHIISSSLEKRGTFAEKVTSNSTRNQLTVIDVATTLVVYIVLKRG